MCLFVLNLDSIKFSGNEYITIKANWLSLTVCSYHVTYALQSESTLYSCLNFKELLETGAKSEV